MTPLVPVILCGGSGTRLWPISRQAFPKPFIKLADGESLLQKTFCRAAELPDVSHLLTVTNREYVFRTKDEYKTMSARLKGVKTSFILEPFGRNTAPAIALAMMRGRELAGADVILLVLSSDHLIEDRDAFNRAVRAARVLAESGRIVTFGIPPTGPATGFGYIQVAKPLDESGGATISRFVEKPDLDTAKAYFESGQYLWNSGIFCFAASTMSRALEQFAPEVLPCIERAWAEIRGRDSEMVEVDAGLFSEVPDISIDYAVLEKSPDVALIRSAFGWSDIGSWTK